MVGNGESRVSSPYGACDLAIEDEERPDVGSAVFVGVRPEKLTILKDGAAGGGEANRVAGEVLEVAYLGERSVFHVRTPGGKVVKVTQANDRRVGGPLLSSGDAVHLSWAPSSSILLRG